MATDTSSKQNTYSGKLTLDKVEFKINSCAVSFRRDTGPDGRPASTVYGGKIVITAPATEKSLLVDHMVNAKGDGLAGQVDLWEAGGKASIFRTITFKKAFLCEYHENFDVTGGAPFSCTFTISAETIAVGASEHSNAWPENS